MTLAARTLGFGFGARVVGAGLDLELPEREIVCLLGPNGSGKTTLLRTLLGLLAPLAGEVALDGRALAAWPIRERAARLAYVPQAAESHFDYSVLETVEMGRTAHRGLFSAPGERDRQVAQASLERLGIAALAERAIHRVSGGERQLALIARALASEAAHVLMDEPTASLDFGNQALILDEIARLKASGTAVLFTTHHPDHALRIADRVVMLRGGRVLAAGSTAAVVNSENLSALYGRAIDVADVLSPDGVARRTCIARLEARPGDLGRPRFD
jgi:iron complex transport system ATP-binding protein